MTKTWYTLLLVSYVSSMLGSPTWCKHLPVFNFLSSTWFYASCISLARLVLKVKFTWAQTSRLTATMGLQVPLSDSGFQLHIVFKDDKQEITKKPWKTIFVKIWQDSFDINILLTSFVEDTESYFNRLLFKITKPTSLIEADTLQAPECHHSHTQVRETNWKPVHKTGERKIRNWMKFWTKESLWLYSNLKIIQKWKPSN